MNQLKDKVVLVTGGSRGIGRAVVLAFAAEGAKVCFTYLGSAEKAHLLMEEVKLKYATEIEALEANAADFTTAVKLVDDLVLRWGSIDVVVNNAGITRDNLILRMTEEQFDTVIANNLKSVFNYTKAAARHMLKQRAGAFVNISSVVGTNGNAGQANYAASKAGIVAFTKSIAKELGSRGIRANAIAPGFIATEMTHDLPEAELAKWTSGIALGRAGTAEDVANLCVFLASDKAAYLTGQVITLDGGMA